MQSITI